MAACERVGLVMACTVACIIQALRKADVEYLVAPYEADAQLAYMIRNGLVDAVITEDADLIPFGCHTVRICKHAVALSYV